MGVFAFDITSGNSASSDYHFLTSVGDVPNSKPIATQVPSTEADDSGGSIVTRAGSEHCFSNRGSDDLFLGQLTLTQHVTEDMDSCVFQISPLKVVSQAGLVLGHDGSVADQGQSMRPLEPAATMKVTKDESSSEKLETGGDSVQEEAVEVASSIIPTGRSGQKIMSSQMCHHISAVQEEWSSPRLKTLAEQLRHYRAPPSPSPPPSPANEDGVTSSIGMPASEAKRNNSKVVPIKRRAAVLMCLYQGVKGEVRVILTKRARSLSSHGGEVALPGGKRDEGDVDDTATALREAHEEIGLHSSHVRVVTSLEPFLSKNLLTVIPVVGLLDEKHQFTPVPNPGEVDAIFDAPLEMFLMRDENYWFQEREWLGVKYRVHFFDYTTADGDKFLVWGLTASMLIKAASIIYQRKPDFLELPPDFGKMMSYARGLGCNPVTKPGTTDKKTED